MIELKLKYNALIERFKKAEAYMESENVSLENKKKWLAQFVDLIWNLNDILNQLKTNGFTFTSEEIQNGFDVSVEDDAV